MKATGKPAGKQEQQTRERSPFSLNLAALERVIQIHYQLQNKRYPNARTLAEEFKMSKDSMERVLAYMQDRLRFPMDYDASKHGWYYTMTVDKFPVITLDAKDLFGLTLLEEVLKQYAGTPLYAPLRAVFDKLLEFASPNTQYHIDNAEQIFSTRPIRSTAIDVEKFNTVQTAIDQRRVMKVLYRCHGTWEYYEEYLMPYGFAFVGDRWYVLADSPGRKKIYKYVVGRIKNPEITQEEFERDKDYDPSKILKGAFRIMTGTGDYKVELELDLWATDIVCDRLWHETQQLEVCEETGSSRMTMQLSALEEVTCWILSHHIHVKVVGPPELKEKRREYIRQLAIDEGFLPPVAITTQ